MKHTFVLAALCTLAGCQESPTAAEGCAVNADCAATEVCVAETCIPAGGVAEGEGEGEDPIDATPRLSSSRLLSGAAVSSSASGLCAVHHLTVFPAAPMRAGRLVVTTH